MQRLLGPVVDVVIGASETSCLRSPGNFGPTSVAEVLSELGYLSVGGERDCEPFLEIFVGAARGNIALFWSD
jgi:hypothetical protein